MMVEEYTTEDFMEAMAQEAREMGHAEGKIEERLEVARNALAEGVSIDLIQRITGLDSETIKNL